MVLVPVLAHSRFLSAAKGELHTFRCSLGMGKGATTDGIGTEIAEEMLYLLKIGLDVSRHFRRRLPPLGCPQVLCHLVGS